MKVAVITPYHAETHRQLFRCTRSVYHQSHADITHIMVGDGPVGEAEKFTFDSKHIQWIKLPVAHADYGDTPRMIGTLSAYQQGFDAVCWLDADCWFDNLHVASMVKLADREVASVVTATRTLRRPDGTLLERADPESNGEDFCDTNCYLVMRDAIPAIAPIWGFKPSSLGVIGDRRVWEVAKTFRRAHLSTATVNYETKIAVHYLQRDEEPPEDARVIVQYPGESRFRSVSYRDFQSINNGTDNSQTWRTR